jgi:hypothetical protein
MTRDMDPGICYLPFSPSLAIICCFFNFIDDYETDVAGGMTV